MSELFTSGHYYRSFSIKYLWIVEMIRDTDTDK